MQTDFLPLREHFRELVGITPIPKNYSRHVFAFNFVRWKRPTLRKLYPEFRFTFLSAGKPVGLQKRDILKARNPLIIVWGMNQPSDLDDFLQTHKIEIHRIEDGFVRSCGLGSDHTLPYSLCIDTKGIYFNSRATSDLEELLNTYDFQADPHLIERAEKCISLLVDQEITKYNLPQTSLAKKLYGPKQKKRILVIGQVEDDQSILFGCDQETDNNKLVRLAAQENPDSQIIYKIHPDVLASKRASLSNPDDVRDLCEIISEPMTLDDALTGVDRVYTITSLAGFEALLRGIPVTVLGGAFYAGWGQTDSRQDLPRRSRSLSLTELFAGAYLLYPRYFSPHDGSPMTLEQTIRLLHRRRQMSASISSHPPKEKAFHK